jgi:hypothetical protein
MNYDAIIRDTERGRGRKVIVLVLALMLVAVVIGAVVKGFTGRSTYSGARALTEGAVVFVLIRAKSQSLSGFSCKHEGPHARA